MKSSFPQPLRSVLISIQPEFADKILAGQKVLELRRRWAASPVDALVIYASAPRQMIVAVATVLVVHEGSPSALWQICRTKSAAISRRRFYSYFKGTKLGYAIELKRVVRTNGGVDPKAIFENFRPPQSFNYLPAEQYAKVVRASKH